MSRESLMDEELFCLIVCQRERPHLGSQSMLATTKLQQECSSNGVKKVICLKIMCQRFDLAQSLCRSGHIAQCYCSVQSNNWRGGQRKQQVIEHQNLRPRWWPARTQPPRDRPPARPGSDRDLDGPMLPLARSVLMHRQSLIDPRGNDPAR